ncbi:EscF/YscF/HrpA family type III secretion system needle major subunit [Pseudomonas monteilii]|jgi:type III secretion protein F|uniref:EscF/YscF/HrpA family type III secretion system needle major subunit n=3 Tax=Pseudomonas TaxID=286 RepID=A0A3G2HJ07_9PSED|nr:MULTISPECIES: EscF/YscF/HrpA family type III secretion system needle major subunit [Pseudomonas]MDR2315815.1 EscF/YscF/HrpA family type III secretion system needle major subunit [Pseudomonas sp.]AYN16989.1 EscF/YscF/HrpA family type III secretion system needle major subunit [Pseudomonas monteilii]AYN99389.1 EscF/YscF/HrpA family type III secretion system needle major subunit [Pseudomonas sp. LTGT-11-2Z]MBA1314755.1 EscF/YscF/HrpA family type III secretion system needle major subunit [Pseudom
MSTVSNPIEFHDDFLGRQAQGFEDGATGLKTKLDEALAALHEDASDPTLLAAYQAAFSSYNVFRNVATNTIKGFKEIDTAIVSAAR